MARVHFTEYPMRGDPSTRLMCVALKVDRGPAVRMKVLWKWRRVPTVNNWTGVSGFKLTRA